MNKYKPYKDYRGLCKFKSIKDKNMSWSIMEKYVLNGKYLIRPLRENEIDEVVEIYRIGFPEVYGNTHYEVVLWSDTLKDILGTGNKFMNGDWFLIVVEKLEEKKLIGAMLNSMDKGNMSICWELAAVHPEYRGTKGLFKAMCIYNDELSKKTGAEYASAAASTFHSKSQIILKELGWKVRAVIPGLIAAWNHDNKYYRHPVVYLDKFYNDGKDLVPKEMDLIPEAEKIFKLSENLL